MHNNRNGYQRAVALRIIDEEIAGELFNFLLAINDARIFLFQHRLIFSCTAYALCKGQLLHRHESY